ncbi:hypothetical protein SISNIDRAFT_469586 [Sistotremastrum niveocremeum HHB9708]|uniref:Uncharacterized protein n=1 Tax=Sistotremastrum niveocremeum HHB9708 TaxID=1314777 RepID=A0A164PVR6_9AGAM|nr:hypothetical protein SISNIDRAFT_469586 [Sistotremastrum niveocremeum HHB9708]
MARALAHDSHQAETRSRLGSFGHPKPSGDSTKVEVLDMDDDCCSRVLDQPSSPVTMRYQEVNIVSEISKISWIYDHKNRSSTSYNPQHSRARVIPESGLAFPQNGKDTRVDTLVPGRSVLLFGKARRSHTSWMSSLCREARSRQRWSGLLRLQLYALKVTPAPAPFVTMYPASLRTMFGENSGISPISVEAESVHLQTILTFFQTQVLDPTGEYTTTMAVAYLIADIVHARSPRMPKERKKNAHSEIHSLGISPSAIRCREHGKDLLLAKPLTGIGIFERLRIASASRPRQARAVPPVPRFDQYICFRERALFPIVALELSIAIVPVFFLGLGLCPYRRDSVNTRWLLLLSEMPSVIEAVPSYYRFAKLAHRVDLGIGSDPKHWAKRFTHAEIPEITRTELEAIMSNVAKEVEQFQRGFSRHLSLSMSKQTLKDLISLFMCEFLEEIVTANAATALPGKTLRFNRPNMLFLDVAKPEIEREEGWDICYTFHYFDDKSGAPWFSSIETRKFYFHIIVARPGEDGQHTVFESLPKANKSSILRSPGRMDQRQLLLRHLTRNYSGSDGGYLVLSPTGTYVIPLFKLEYFLDSGANAQASSIDSFNKQICKKFITESHHLRNIFKAGFWGQPRDLWDLE